MSSALPGVPALPAPGPPAPAPQAVPAQVLLCPANAGPSRNVNSSELVILRGDHCCRVSYPDASSPLGYRLCDTATPFASRQALREHVLFWHASASRNEILLVFGSRHSDTPAGITPRQHRYRSRRARRPCPAASTAVALPADPGPAAQAAARNAVLAMAQTLGLAMVQTMVQAAAATGTASGSQTGQTNVTQVLQDGGDEHVV